MQRGKCPGWRRAFCSRYEVPNGCAHNRFLFDGPGNGHAMMARGLPTRFRVLNCHEGLAQISRSPFLAAAKLSQLHIGTLLFLTIAHPHDRFCSLSWYDRQLVENSRSGYKNGNSTNDDDGEEEEEGEGALVEGDAGAVDTTSLSSSPRPHGSDVGVGVGFGSRARPAEASVMATLKARGEAIARS